MKDLHNSIKAVRAISPVSEAGNTALVSEIIDRAGFESLEFVIATGSLGDAGAQFTVLVEDGEVSNLSDNAAVTDANLLGTEAGASFIETDDNRVFKIGYRGGKRYVRMTITPANNGTAALISAVALLGHAAVGPQDDQSI